MTSKNHIVETQRTLVSRIELNDALFFVRLVNTEDWLKYIGNRNVENAEDARRFLENGFLKSYNDHGFGYYVIRMQQDRQPIGICGFLKKDYLDNPDFGFALLPEFYGQGLALEACQSVLEYGFRTFGFKMLDAVTLPENAPSMRLLERLEFQRKGLVALPGDDRELLLFRRQID